MSTLPRRSAQPVAGFEKRLAVLIVLLSLIYVILAGNFWYLQITGHDRYQHLADNNRIRLVEMPATRGILRDATGRIIADSTPSYNLAVVPEDMEGDPEEGVAAAARLLDLAPEAAVERFREAAGGAPYRAVTIAYNLDRRQVALFEAERDRFPGASLRIEPRRYYPFGDLAAHMLGYVGEVSPEQLQRTEFPGARRGDIVGKYGLERQYDDYLRGRDGGRQVEVDARGRELAILGVTEPVPGSNVHLTVDFRLQETLEELLGDERGAGVLLDVETGAVLAMASRPAFDPNEFSLGISGGRWADIVRDPGHPLQSRAVAGLYPPGSTFKVVTAVASIMEGTVEPDGKIRCRGSYRFGRRTYRDWKLSGHGQVDLFRSLVESCDVYYYQAGEKLGIESLSRWGKVMGLGSVTGIDLPGEKAGLMPTPIWKQKVRGEKWYPGETLSVAIGQGYLLVTPLQLASLYATIAREGDVLEPYIVARIDTVDGEALYRKQPVVRRRLPIHEETWQRIRRGLAGVVSEDAGTGRGARIRGFMPAGKTGTAQVVRLQEWAGRDEEDIPYELRDHGWFAAYAPSDDPRVAAVVVVEHGGHGSSSAAPIVRRLFERYRELYGDQSGEEVEPLEAASGAHRVPAGGGRRAIVPSPAPAGSGGRREAGI